MECDYEFDPNTPTEGWPIGAGIASRVSGVYAFFAFDGPNEVCLYVGKGFCVRSRILWHTMDGLWTNEFWDDVWNERLNVPLFVRVWTSNERAGLEARKIEELQPRYNRRSE